MDMKYSFTPCSCMCHFFINGKIIQIIQIIQMGKLWNRLEALSSLEINFTMRRYLRTTKCNTHYTRSNKTVTSQ